MGDKLKAVVLLGQSNAQGQSLVVSNLTTPSRANEYTDSVCAMQLQCNSDSQADACSTELPFLCTIADPLGLPVQTKFGPEIGIAEYISASSNIKSHNGNWKTPIVKCTTGSTGLDSIANQLTGDWSPEATSGYELYDRTVNFTAWALNNYAGAGNWEIAGCIVAIGETDASNLAAANDFSSRMQSLVNAFRAEDGWRTDCHFVLCRCPHTDGSQTYKATVRAGVASAAAALDDCEMMSIDGYATQVDNVHLDEDGAADLGYDAMALIDAAIGPCN